MLDKTFKLYLADYQGIILFVDRSLGTIYFNDNEKI